jgi:hypothetical protein
VRYPCPVTWLRTKRMLEYACKDSYIHCPMEGMMEIVLSIEERAVLTYLLKRDALTTRVEVDSDNYTLIVSFTDDENNVITSLRL